VNRGNNWSSLINALIYNQFTFVIGPWDIPIPQNGVFFNIIEYIYIYIYIYMFCYNFLNLKIKIIELLPFAIVLMAKKC